MTIQALGIMKTAFSACVTWTNQLLSAVDGSGVILAGFCIMLVVSLLFIPMRGMAIYNGMSSLNDFTAQTTYRGKYSNSRSIPKGGKFQKGSHANFDYRANMRALSFAHDEKNRSSLRRFKRKI